MTDIYQRHPTSCKVSFSIPYNQSVSISDKAGGRPEHFFESMLSAEIRFRNKNPITYLIGSLSELIPKVPDAQESTSQMVVLVVWFELPCCC